MVKNIHKLSDVAVTAIVADDDSTFRAKIRHSYQAKIDSPDFPSHAQDSWPRREIKRGKRAGKFEKLKDCGTSPLHVPEVAMDCADPSHRARVIASHLYKLARAAKSVNKFGLEKKTLRESK